MPKVLISDRLSAAAVQIFRDRNIETVFEPDLGKDPDALKRAVADVDGLAIRSASKVTADVLEAAKNLKVVGRAGIGVDNVDIPAATARGVVVMNTPYGNAVTTAEHAIAMMFALARQIPQANESTHAGKWEKSRFMGVELFNKTLGIIGCGNIGSIVASRALGLKMKVVAFDPYLTPERALELGVKKVELDELLAKADVITLHTPLTDQTRNVLSRDALAKTKKGVRIVNCARGGLIDEAALKDALDAGQVAGAALDVFETEPATEHPLFGNDKVVATPHLGAATAEAQENVALQIADQMADYLLTGAVSNALNMPSITAEEAPKLTPFLKLAEKLGLFAGQLTETGIEEIEVIYAGEVAELNVKPLTQTAVAGVLKPMLQGVNIVSAPAVAHERGVAISETVKDEAGAYDSIMTLRIRTERQTRTVSGVVFAGEPRVVGVKGVRMDAEFSEHMLYVTNTDKPGFIGALGGALGAAGVNIGTFNLGRADTGDEAIALVAVDEPVGEALLKTVMALEHVRQAKPLAF